MQNISAFLQLLLSTGKFFIYVINMKWLLFFFIYFEEQKVEDGYANDILLKTLTTKTLFLKSLLKIMRNNKYIYVFNIMSQKTFSRLIISFHSSSDESCDEDDDGELLPKDEGKISAKIFFNIQNFNLIIILIIGM